MSEPPTIHSLLDHTPIARNLVAALLDELNSDDYILRCHPVRGRGRPSSAWVFARTCHQAYEAVAPRRYRYLAIAMFENEKADTWTTMLPTAKLFVR